MEKSFEYRIYPDAHQRQIIAQTFGCVRFVYNRALAIRKDAYEAGKMVPSINDCIKMIPAWKVASDTSWLKDADSVALQQSLRDLDKAYKNFFRNPGKVGFPKFKSKHCSRQTYRTNNITILDSKHIKLPKLGIVNARVSRPVEGRILSATVKRVASGKYFVSVCCTDVAQMPLPKTEKVVGIDLGINTEIVCSDGKTHPSPKAYTNAQAKLAREQRCLSRKSKGSKNYAKQRRKVARCHEKVANQRKDFTNKATTALVHENQVVCAESLNVKGMVKNHHLAKALADAAFGEVVRQLAYKCEWNGRTFVQVDMWYPSSKTCSCCGHVQDMPLSKRTYICPECGMSLNRDVNAAKNILNEGMNMLGWGTPEANACGEGISPAAA